MSHLQLVCSAALVLLFSHTSMAFSSFYRSSIRNTVSRLSTRSINRALPLKLSMSTSVEPTTAEVIEPEEDLFGFDLPTNDNSPQLLKTRHTASHIMAMAVQRLHKEAQVTIGPWIDNGFYYDFYFPNHQLSENDLKLIKKEMDKIIKADLPMRREEVTREEARYAPHHVYIDNEGIILTF